jgi:hypothetical protein
VISAIPVFKTCKNPGLVGPLTAAARMPLHGSPVVGGCACRLLCCRLRGLATGKQQRFAELNGRLTNLAGQDPQEKIPKPTAKTWRTCVRSRHASSWSGLAIGPKLAKLRSSHARPGECGAAPTSVEFDLAEGRRNLVMTTLA